MHVTTKIPADQCDDIFVIDLCLVIYALCLVYEVFCSFFLPRVAAQSGYTLPW